MSFETHAISPGARTVEYAFIINKMSPMQKGKALDVGCVARNNLLPQVLTGFGWEVWGIDIRPFTVKLPNFHFAPGDVTNTTFADGFFDCIYAVSTIEHIGLAGRYGVTEDDLSGDTRVLKEIERILCPGGILLVTMPYGKRKVIPPLERIYDREQLQELFSDWQVKEQVYYAPDTEGCWCQVPEEVAAKVQEMPYTLTLMELVSRQH